MKILVVISKYLPEYSGAGHRIHTLYQHLKQNYADLEVEVLCAGTEYETAETYTVDGIPVERIACRSSYASNVFTRIWREWGQAWAGWRACSQRQFDVMHVIGTAPLCAAALHYSRSKNIPLMRELVTKNAPISIGLPVLAKLWKPNLQKQAVITVISPSLREQARQQGFNRNIWQRHNPVDTNRFYSDENQKKNLRKEIAPFADDDKVIGMIANFTPNKNHIFLLDVLRLMDERYKLLLAGPYVEDGALGERNKAYMRSIKDKISAYNLGHRVHLRTGFVDAAAYMKTMDIYAMPNVHEGLGTPFLEAVACGIPVVANAEEQAFRDMLEDAGLGFVNDLDPQEWAESFKKCDSFSVQERHAAAKKIRNICALESCAHNYFLLFSRLQKSAKDEVIDIKETLAVSDLPQPYLKRNQV